MILEGIMTTQNSSGVLNIAPMGPIVDESMQRLLLRPYQSSTTYQNLKQSRRGVFHVTDDVEMLAAAAIGQLPPPATIDVAEAGVPVLAGACRWYGVEVDTLDDSQERTEIVCRTTAQGRLRDFFGLNRAKHAVVEAAILATRIKMLPGEEIRRQYEQLSILVEKTAGDAERRAFEKLSKYVESYQPEA
jgi:hypothetical protein